MNHLGVNRLDTIRQAVQRINNEKQDQFLSERIAAYTLKQEYIEIENNLENELLELDFN